MESSPSKHALQLALPGGVLAVKLGNYMRAVPLFVVFRSCLLAGAGDHGSLMALVWLARAMRLHADPWEPQCCAAGPLPKELCPLYCLEELLCTAVMNAR